MAERTLSDLNIELEAVNKTLDEQTVGQGRLIDAVEDLVNLQRQSLDDLEDKVEDAAPTQGRGAGSGGGGGGFPFARAQLGILGAAATLPGLIAAASGSLLKKGLGPAIVTVFADEIGELIASQTGNQELGKAVERGLVAGGILSIFSKRLGIVGGLVAATMNKDNQEKAKSLFEKDLKPKLEEFKKAIGNLGFKIPTVNEMLQGATNAAGGALDSLTALARGDFKGFADNLGDLALTAAGIMAILSPKSLLRVGIKTATVAGGAAAAAAGIKTAKGAQARAARASTPGTINKQTGRLIGVDGKDTVLKKGDKGFDAAQKQIQAQMDKVSKYPRLGKAFSFIRSFPGLASAMGIYELLTMDPITVDGVAGILGGIGGASLGGLAGGLIGAAGGPLAFVTSAIGAAGGFLAGDTLAKGLAQYLLGKKVDAFPDFLGINQALNSSNSNEPGVSSPDALAAANTYAGGNVGGGEFATAPPRNTGASVAQSTAAVNNNAMGANLPPIVSAPTTMSIGSSQTTFAGGGVSATDPRRPNLSVGTSY